MLVIAPGREVTACASSPGLVFSSALQAYKRTAIAAMKNYFITILYFKESEN